MPANSSFFSPDFLLREGEVMIERSRDGASADASPLASMSDVLARVSQELRGLASAVDGLEDLIGNLVVAGSFSGSHSVYELQSLDLLRQSLHGIADFLDHAEVSPADCKIDAQTAAQAVTLAALSRRLSAVADTATDDTDASGEFELFESAA